ncbi:hypothetical protein GGQ63_000001, partial [Prosthecomicrobium pneumaticum]|nr:hypothetical protein [Prosthecomicrobium pneumaticum]
GAAGRRAGRSAPESTVAATKAPVTPASVPGSIIGPPGRPRRWCHPAHPPPRLSSTRGREAAPGPRTGSDPHTRHPREGEDPSRPTVRCCMDSRLREDDGWGGRPRSTGRHDYGCRHAGRHDGWRGVFEDIMRVVCGAAGRRAGRSAPESTVAATKAPVTPASVPGSMIGPPGRPRRWCHFARPPPGSPRQGEGKPRLVRAPGPTHTPVILAKARVHHARPSAVSWFPAFAGMTDGGVSAQSAGRHDYGCRHGGRHDGWRGCSKAWRVVCGAAGRRAGRSAPESAIATKAPVTPKRRPSRLWMPARRPA